MISLSKPAHVAERQGNRAVFEVEELYPGYGITVGNSLRRVLLSSLDGAAVTRVNIKGVPHEFSTIPGMQEDVIGLLLNIKQICVTLYGAETQKGVLKVKGEKEVRAGDIEFPSQVELVNEDLVLCHLTDKKAELEMEFFVEPGVGYAPVRIEKKEKGEIGTIALDAIFTPVVKVNYHVEQMRVGDRTDFDRLRVEVVTDGTLTPEEAFYKAVSILIEELEVVRGGVVSAVDALKESEESEKEASKKKKAKPKTAKKKA